MSDFKSWSSYWKFSANVQHKSRYVWNADVDQFLDAVAESAASRQVTIPSGQLLWRAQLGSDMIEREAQGGSYQQEWPYGEDRMKPLPYSASDGRVNPRGIPCLYLATQVKTAIGEVRPWIGSYVSVAQFRVSEAIKIVEFGQNKDKNPIYIGEPDPAKRTKSVWSHMDRAFSEPSTRDENSADYAPTQIIAERLKNEGYDGIAYSSSFGDDGYNIALFDLNSAVFVGSLLHKVERISIDTSEQEGRRSAKKIAPPSNPST